MEQLDLLKALHPFLWPVVVVIIAALFRREIRALLNRLAKRDDSKEGEPARKEQARDAVITAKYVKEDAKQQAKAGETIVTARQDDDKGSDILQVRRNRSSGAYFIVLDEEQNSINCITPCITPGPGCTIGWRDKKLFHETEAIAEKVLYQKDPQQMEKYYQYVQSPGDGQPSTRIRQTVTANNGRPNANPNLPVYLNNYINMLNNPNTLPYRMLQCVRKKNGITWDELRNMLHREYGYSETSGSMGASLKALETIGKIRIDGQGNLKRIFS